MSTLRLTQNAWSRMESGGAEALFVQENTMLRVRKSPHMTVDIAARAFLWFQGLTRDSHCSFEDG
jgi:hypothetical protein